MGLILLFWNLLFIKPKQRSKVIHVRFFFFKKNAIINSNNGLTKIMQNVYKNWIQEKDYK